MLAYTNISVLRQQLKPTHRIHGIFEGKDWTPNSKETHSIHQTHLLSYAISYTRLRQDEVCSGSSGHGGMFAHQCRTAGMYVPRLVPRFRRRSSVSFRATSACLMSLMVCGLIDSVLCRAAGLATATKADVKVGDSTFDIRQNKALSGSLALSM